MKIPANLFLISLFSFVSFGLPGSVLSATIEKKGIAYGEHDAQKLDLYFPEKAIDAAVMIYVHGGGWRKGDKKAVGQKVEFFTAQGWIFVSVNYRLLPEGSHPKNAEDIAVAVAWVQQNISQHGGDAGKLFLMGHSAGAHLVSLVATDGRQLKKAGLSLSDIKGVISLDTNAYDIPKLRATSSSPLYAVVFGEDLKIQQDASPQLHVEKGKGIPPFLICYSRGLGKRRNPTRPAAAAAFQAVLNKNGIAAEVLDASDRNHGEINARFGAADDKKVTARAKVFLERVLAGSKP